MRWWERLDNRIQILSTLLPPGGAGVVLLDSAGREAFARGSGATEIEIPLQGEMER